MSQDQPEDRTPEEEGGEEVRPPPEHEGPERTAEEGADSELETGEPQGLGLTQEFARIEADIERDAGGRAGEGSDAPVGDRSDPREPADASNTDRDVSAPADGGSEGADEPAGEEGWVVAGEGASVPDPSEADDDTNWVGDTGDQQRPEPAAEGDTTPEEVVADAEDADAAPDAALAEDASNEEIPREDATPVAAAAAVHPQAAEQPVVRPAPVPLPLPRPGTPRGGGLPPIFTEDELSDRTPSLWLRFLAGSVLVIASMATAVAVTGLLFLSDVAAQLQPIPGIQQQLQEVDPGAPQTILIIGSDRRAGDDPDAGARSDTTMLLRVDPERKILSLFSLPRDLKVDVPGVGPTKLNEAYATGGETRALKTVKRFTGLEINHVVEINFAGFADAVNAIDCVYIDVDRHYFNDNAGIAAGTDQGYAEIDISAGYQRLCGLKALQYVRYRHTDTDLVRAARQQDFLREARQKVQPRELLGAVFGTGTGNELINIFTQYTRSDIGDKNDMIGILKSFINIRDVPVNEVHFEGDIGGPDDPYVTSTDAQVKTAIDQFLNGVGTPGQRGGKAATGAAPKKSDAQKKKKKKAAPEAVVVSSEALSDSKYPTLADRLAADANKNARRLGIPVFYPTEVVPGSSFSTDSRTYEYRNEDDKRESAYKTAIALTSPSTLVEYYGVMGTTWDDPPILRNASEVRKIDGREYLLFYDGDRLRMVGWKEKGNSYWVNNTLVQNIGEAEMLAIAASTREV